MAALEAALMHRSAARYRVLSHITGIHHAALWPSGQHGMASSRRVDEQSVRMAYAYCVQQLQTYDYDNFVWIAQLPKEVRPAMLALRAFNIETALVGDQVRSKEPALMQVRYQWWREGVAATFKGRPPQHPVLLALQDVLQRQQDPAAGVPPQAPGAPRLKQYHLGRIIDAREADALDTQPPLEVQGLETYTEGTASQLAAVGVVSRAADHAASHLGKAVGLATLLKGAAFHAAQRRSYFPIDLCAKHGVSQEAVYAGESSEGLKDVALAVASVAKGHLDEARVLGKDLPRPAAMALLPSLSADAYLQRLEACNFDVFHPSLLQAASGKKGAGLLYVLRVKWHLLQGTF